MTFWTITVRASGGVTNHAVVAMVGDDVKQTRCTTCDAEHEYKHAKVPRQRRKTETPAALYAQVARERAQARRARAPPRSRKTSPDETEREPRSTSDRSADNRGQADDAGAGNRRRPTPTRRRDADDDEARQRDERTRTARCIVR